MWIKSCIVTLMIAYPVFLAFGIWFYRYTQKIKPLPFPADDRRNRTVGPLRFTLYVVLLPVEVTIALAILGWLDPLFHFIKNIRVG